MKLSAKLFGLLFCLAFLFACGGGEGTNSDPDTAAEATSDTEELATICLWPKVGLRSGPGRGKDLKYITTVYLGEKVENTGVTETTEGDDRTYFKAKLSDGTEGWAHDYLFAHQAKLGAITKLSSVYKRPDLVTLTDKKLNFGDIVAVTGEEDGWLEVVGKEKKAEGWIKGTDQVTYNTEDVAVAIMLGRALGEEGTEKKRKALQDILDNPDFEGTLFYEKVGEEVENLDPMAKLEEGQLMITGDNVNVRSAPNVEDDNKLFQLNSGAICEILEVGEDETIGGKNSTWFKIESNGKSGWVFGSFAIANITY